MFLDRERVRERQTERQGRGAEREREIIKYPPCLAPAQCMFILTTPRLIMTPVDIKSWTN